jgi:hypothetical protein
MGGCASPAHLPPTDYSVHWTLGILRHFQAFSTPEQNPALEVLSTPAPAPVTRAVGQLTALILSNSPNR